MSSAWIDTNGRSHEVVLNRKVALRLKNHGICDLGRCLMTPESLSELFLELGSDPEFIVNFAYLAEHETPGDEKHQEAFAQLVWGDGSGGEGVKLLEVSEALTTAVIDFFPEKSRERIRQLWAMRMGEGTERLDDLPGRGFSGVPIRLSDGWEWIEWQCGVIGGNCECLSFREICQRFEGKRYFQMAHSAEIVAGIYNANGGLASGAPAAIGSFHPYHQQDETEGGGLDADTIIRAAEASYGMAEV